MKTVFLKKNHSFVDSLKSCADYVVGFAAKSKSLIPKVFTSRGRAQIALWAALQRVSHKFQ
jgi:hypothetical protein